MWSLLPLQDDPTLASESGLHPLVVSILIQRSITTSAQIRAFLDPEVYSPTLPEHLPGILPAAERIAGAIQQQERVLIWADYDVDGQTSGILLFEALQNLNLEVRCHIAAKHGVDLPQLKRLCTEFSPNLLITCDTGITAIAAAQYLRSQQIDLIIADHHVAGETLPEALAIIYPKYLSQSHPFYELTGVGITALLAQAIYGVLKRSYSGFYDLVALGTLGDVAPLIHENRYFVQKGLRQLRTSRRPGLEALAQIAKVDWLHVSGEDVGFQLVPRLNAFARLGDPQDAFRLLTAKNPAEAAITAAQGESLNQKRRLLSRQIAGAVRGQVQQDPALLKWAALVIENPQWDAGVLGAVAGQIAQEFRRPTVLLVSGEDGIAHGSARSYGGYDLHAAVESIADILNSFGGHAGAVGLSLSIENIPLLRRRLSNALQLQHPEPPALEITAELRLDQITFDLVSDLERLSPFGNGNPRPVFVSRQLRLISSTKFGIEDQHWRLTVRDDQGITRQIIWWNGSHYSAPDGIFDLAYQLSLVFRDDQHDIQLTFVDWQQVAEIETDHRIKPDLIDCRNGIDLASIQAKEASLQIWAEGYSQRESPGIPLSDLQPAAALVIYTTPAHADLLGKALDQVQPQRVYFYGEQPAFEEAEPFLQGLVALLKGKVDAEVSLSQIAERLAQTPGIISLAIEALGSNISYTKISRNKYKITRIAPAIRVNPSPALTHALAEAAAYRRYLRRIDLEHLLE